MMLILMMVPRSMVGVAVVVTRSERGERGLVRRSYSWSICVKMRNAVFFGFFIKVFSSLWFRFRQIKIRETNCPFQPLKVRNKVPKDFMFWLILSWHSITYVSRGVQCRGQQRGRKAEDWRKMSGCSGSEDSSPPCPSQNHTGKKKLRGKVVGEATDLRKPNQEKRKSKNCPSHCPSQCTCENNPQILAAWLDDNYSL